MFTTCTHCQYDARRGGEVGLRKSAVEAREEVSFGIGEDNLVRTASIHSEATHNYSMTTLNQQGKRTAPPAVFPSAETKKLHRDPPVYLPNAARNLIDSLTEEHDRTPASSRPRAVSRR